MLLILLSFLIFVFFCMFIFSCLLSVTYGHFLAKDNLFFSIRLSLRVDMFSVFCGLNYFCLVFERQKTLLAEMALRLFLFVFIYLSCEHP